MTGQVSALAVFQFLAAILFMIGPLESVVESIPSFNRANVSLERLQRLEQDMDRVENERVELVGVVPLLEFSRIALRGVSYHFHSGQSDDRFQLGPIDLEIERGEVLFIIGGNGSGKTTLLKILTGLYPPDTGQIIVDSTPLDERHRCAYREMFSTVFSDFHLFRLLFGIEDPEPSRVSDLLEELDLARKIHFEGDRFSSIRLSTGQRKRLAYMIARLENRRIFVFDEFGADQDPGFRRVFYHQIIPELKRQGKTVIAVTHDDHFFDCCDRVIKLDYGRIETLEREHLPANRAPVRRAAPE
jgi:putative ATP-binding cassette transporter